MPLKTRAVEKSAPYLEIAAHPKFEELMRAIFFVRQIGEKPEQQRRLSELHKRSTENIVRARKELGQQQRSSDPDLEQLLVRYVSLSASTIFSSRQIISSFLTDSTKNSF